MIEVSRVRMKIWLPETGDNPFYHKHSESPYGFLIQDFAVQLNKAPEVVESYFQVLDEIHRRCNIALNSAPIPRHPLLDDGYLYQALGPFQSGSLQFDPKVYFSSPALRAAVIAAAASAALSEFVDTLKNTAELVEYVYTVQERHQRSLLQMVQEIADRYGGDVTIKPMNNHTFRVHSRPSSPEGEGT